MATHNFTFDLSQKLDPLDFVFALTEFLDEVGVDYNNVTIDGDKVSIISVEVVEKENHDGN